MTKPGIVNSEQYGRRRCDFAVPASAGGFVILPKASGDGETHPWIWYAPSFIKDPYPLPKDLHAWIFGQLLDAGFAVAGVDVGESWGSQAGRAVFTDFLDIATANFPLANKACLLAQSRGGTMHYNWAVEHPDRVQCVGGIYPVCEIYQPRWMETIADACGLSIDQLVEQAAMYNPMDRLAPLAEADVPILHIHGDADEMVPMEANSGEFVRRYTQHGGHAELIVMPGRCHEEVDAFFKCQALVDFFLENGRDQKQWAGQ